MAWLKQIDKPLFPEILWSRPENKNGAGRLLIIGGNAHSVAAPAKAFETAEAAGAGAVRVLLPDDVKKTFGKFMPDAYFTPSTPSGSFSQKALDEMLLHADWADCVLLAGDIGHNSETATLIEKFVFKYRGCLCITQDVLDSCYPFADKLVTRENTLIVGSFAQTQKLATSSDSAIPLQFADGIVRTVAAMEQWSSKIVATILTRKNEDYYLAKSGRVITSKASTEKSWRVQTAAKASVWWQQNIQMQLEAVASSLLE